MLSWYRGTPIRKVRQQVGHLHYFSPETALATTEDSAYEIIDHLYRPHWKMPGRWKSPLLLARMLLRLLIGQPAAARIAGGHSLMVLARRASA